MKKWTEIGRRDGLESSEWRWRHNRNIWLCSEPWFGHTWGKESCACSCFRTNPHRIRICYTPTSTTGPTTSLSSSFFFFKATDNFRASNHRHHNNLFLLFIYVDFDQDSELRSESDGWLLKVVSIILIFGVNWGGKNFSFLNI